MESSPEILKTDVAGESFIQAVLTPHRAYYNSLRDIFGKKELVGLAHITGGGIQENLNRILPGALDAEIALDKIRILPIFKTLKQFGNLEDRDMLRTFNMGVGMTAVVKPTFVEEAIAHFKQYSIVAYELGRVKEGSKKVVFTGNLQWE